MNTRTSIIIDYSVVYSDCIGTSLVFWICLMKKSLNRVATLVSAMCTISL